MRLFTFLKDKNQINESIKKNYSSHWSLGEKTEISVTSQ